MNEEAASICGVVLREIDILNKRISKILMDFEQVYYMKDGEGKPSISEQDMAKLINKIVTQVKMMEEQLDALKFTMKQFKDEAYS